MPSFALICLSLLTAAVSAEPSSLHHQPLHEFFSLNASTPAANASTSAANASTPACIGAPLPAPSSSGLGEGAVIGIVIAGIAVGCLLGGLLTYSVFWVRAEIGRNMQKTNW